MDQDPCLVLQAFVAPSTNELLASESLLSFSLFILASDEMMQSRTDVGFKNFMTGYFSIPDSLGLLPLS